MSELDQQSKQRLIGASIWLLALVIIVPMWYSNPVNFSPDGKLETTQTSTLPTVEHAYRLPVSEHAKKEIPVTDGQMAQERVQQTEAIKLPEKINEQLQQLAVPAKVESVEKQTLIAPEFIDKVSENPAYAEQWIVLLLPFDNTQQANKLAERLQGKHPVYIKYFEKTRIYSVRTGPYISRAKAEKAKEKLDRILRTNGEVRQLPKTP